MPFFFSAENKIVDNFFQKNFNISFGLEQPRMRKANLFSLASSNNDLTNWRTTLPRESGVCEREKRLDCLLPSLNEGMYETVFCKGNKQTVICRFLKLEEANTSIALFNFLDFYQVVHSKIWHLDIFVWLSGNPERG